MSMEKAEKIKGQREKNKKNKKAKIPEEMCPEGKIKRKVQQDKSILASEKKRKISSAQEKKDEKQKNKHIILQLLPSIPQGRVIPCAEYSPDLKTKTDIVPLSLQSSSQVISESVSSSTQQEVWDRIKKSREFQSLNITLNLHKGLRCSKMAADILPPVFAKVERDISVDPSLDPCCSYVLETDPDQIVLSRQTPLPPIIVREWGFLQTFIWHCNDVQTRLDNLTAAVEKGGQLLHETVQKEREICQKEIQKEKDNCQRDVERERENSRRIGEQKDHLLQEAKQREQFLQEFVKDHKMEQKNTPSSKKPPKKKTSKSKKRKLAGTDHKIQFKEALEEIKETLEFGKEQKMEEKNKNFIKTVHKKQKIKSKKRKTAGTDHEIQFQEALEEIKETFKIFPCQGRPCISRKRKGCQLVYETLEDGPRHISLTTEKGELFKRKYGQRILEFAEKQ